MKQKDFKDSRLIEAFDYIDPKYIAEVADSLKLAPAGGAHVHSGRFNRRTWRHIVALAACLLLLGTVIPVVSHLIRYLSNAGTTSSEITTELTEPETPPEETTTPHPESTEEETTTPPTEITEEETTSEETTAEETTAEETTAEETTAEETTAEETTAEETTSPHEPEYDGTRGLEYKISDDGTYAILVGIGTCTDKDIVVATYYNGVPVKVIGESALFDEKADSIRVSDMVEIIEEEALGAGKYTSLYISASVRQLEGAFSSCDSLEKIEVDKNNPIYRSVNNCLINTQTKALVLGCINSVIPADGSVTKIGTKAFETVRFTNITIPEGITEIGKEAFAWCMMLESITIPDSVKIIGDLAFSDCERAKTVKLGKGVESIGNGAFYCCFLITEIELPQSLKYLGGSAFANSRIKSLVIPDGVKLPEGAHNMFASYNYLESIVLPSGIESFGSWFFGGCENLKSITIPSSVKVIGDYAFYGCRSLKEIIIPEGVTEIGEGAFKQCTGITSIVVPESVKSIGNKAFAGCTELVSITLPSSITEISASSFSECAKLQSINIPNGVTSIGSYAFRSCTSLESLTLPDSVKRIGEYAFNGCSALKDIDLGEGLESIETWAFENCTSLKQIEFPESMKEIVKYAFVRSGLESIRIPNGIKRINDGVFGACASLKDVSLPEGLTEIGYNAFSYCTSLETLVIPNTVTMIGGGVFGNCTALKSLTIPSSVKVLQGSEHFMNCTSLVSMTIPEGITMQFEYYNMFDGCTSLTSVTLPRDLPRVSREIFKNCSALTEINYGGTVAQWNNLKKQDNWNSGCAATVVHCTDGDVEVNEYDGSRGLEYRIEGDHAVLVGIGTCTDKDIVTATTYNGVPVTEINAFAFENISSITSVTVSEGVTHIGLDAFDNLTDLRAVYLPSTLESIYGGEGIAFYECHNIEIISVSPNNPKFYSIGNCMIEKDSGTLVFGCKASVIPTDGSIKSIGIFAFSGLQSITSIVIPEGVTVIEGYAFSGCKNLKSVSLPGSLTEIKWSAFSSCEALESIHLGDNVIHIGSGAFGGCTSLREVRLPSKVESFGEEIFAGCAIESVIIPDGVTHLHGGMFINCKDLKRVTLPEGIENIGLYAFTRCTALTDIDVPVSVREIGQYAFSECTALERITIPRNTEKIDKYVFYGCTSLDKFYFLGTKAEWETVNKGEGWNEGCPFTVIHCSDGDVEA